MDLSRIPVVTLRKPMRFACKRKPAILPPIKGPMPMQALYTEPEDVELLTNHDVLTFNERIMKGELRFDPPFSTQVLLVLAGLIGYRDA